MDRLYVQLQYRCITKSFITRVACQVLDLLMNIFYVVPQTYDKAKLSVTHVTCKILDQLMNSFNVFFQLTLVKKAFSQVSQSCPFIFSWTRLLCVL